MWKILFSILLSFYVSYIYAYDIEINGLRYNVISLTELTAALVGVKDKYPEEFTISESIVYNSKELTITAFYSRAFDQQFFLTDKMKRTYLRIVKERILRFNRKSEWEIFWLGEVSFYGQSTLSQEKV